MPTQYIVGRPLQINGEQFDIGDKLKDKHIAAIPRVEAWISSRFIFRVITTSDRDQLPNFVIAKMHEKEEALAKIKANGTENVGPIDGQIDAEKADATSRVREVATNQMEIQDWIYDQANRDVVVTDPDPVEDEQQPETDEAAEEVTESEEPTEDIVTETVIPGDVFNPGEHSVAEVKDYLASNTEDAERVKEVEAAGKGRKGILEA